MLPGLEVANFDSWDRSTWEIFRRDSAASQCEARLYCKSSPLDEIGFPKVMKVCLASCQRISGTGSRTGGRAGPGGGGRSAAPRSARAPPAGTACSSRSCAPRSDDGLWSGEGSCQWRSLILRSFSCLWYPVWKSGSWGQCGHALGLRNLRAALASSRRATDNCFCRAVIALLCSE